MAVPWLCLKRFICTAAGVVVVLPWLYPETDMDKHKVFLNRWIGWGLSLLTAAILFFTVAFAAAGLITGSYKAPEPCCGVLPCEFGGMPGIPSTQASTNVFKTLLPLSNMSADCFAVWGIADGGTFLADHTAGHNSSVLMQVTDEMFESDLNDGHNASYINANVKKDACYLKIRDTDYSNEEQHLTHTKTILCTAGPVPS